jgi:hypothetical protein
LAEAVAKHKACFFRENDTEGRVISYEAAIRGRLQLEPQGKARDHLADDYSRMTDSGLFEDDAPPFDVLMEACRTLQEEANQVANVHHDD